MEITAASSLLSQIDRELWLITACSGASRGGLIATFVCQASIVIERPRMLIGLSRQHHTYDLVDKSRAFALHLLGEDHLDLVWRFGLQSGRDVDKLAGLNMRPGVTGSPLLTDTLGWLDCRVEGRLNTGDRSIYLASVVDAQQMRTGPLLKESRLVQLAPSDKLQRLAELMTRDRAVDAAAIAAWQQLIEH